MTEYSQIKVINKDLVSTFFDKDLKCFKILRLHMSHRPLSFLQVQQWLQIGWQCDSRYRHFAHNTVYFTLKLLHLVDFP